MADRRSERDGEGPVKRQRQQTEAPEQQDHEEKEQNVPEQDLFGNSFLVDQMQGRNTGAPPADAGLEVAVEQDYGGIEDVDAPPPGDAADDQWFHPTLRRKDDVAEPPAPPPADPGLGPEDEAWLAGLAPLGEPWPDPAPQPPPAILADGLGPWLRALFPIAGPLAHQHAIALAQSGDPSLQDPGGDALIGIACAAALGARVASHVGGTPEGRARVTRGLAIASAAAVAQDVARSAVEQAALGPATAVPEVPPDTWLARLIAARIGLDRPPLPELADPPPLEADPDDALGLDALVAAELGAPPDPMEALRAAALEGCEGQARWAVALRQAAAAIARAAAETGVDPGALSAALTATDQQFLAAVQLLQEIAQAARAGVVPIRGLRNGLARAARLLGAAHQATVEGLARAATLVGVVGEAPEPTDPRLAVALQDGRPIPELEAGTLPLVDDLRAAVRALGDQDTATARRAAARVSAQAAEHQDGVGFATGVLLEVAALSAAGDHEAAKARRDRAGAVLLGAGARSGLSLLARWRPAEPATDEPEPES